MQIPSNLPSLAARSNVIETLNPRLMRSYSVPVQRRSATAIVNIPLEPEDAKITGTTRSLSRRLLALNFKQDS